METSMLLGGDSVQEDHCPIGWATCRDSNLLTRFVGYFHSPAFTELVNGPIGIGAGLLLPVLLFMFLPFFGQKKPTSFRGAEKYEANKED